ncbi:MAG TPA: discoidin domain-containing protein [Verrucomicrobiae bacterium]|jgi:beta-galactosidase|nr:discoidin domain-containing protein [Verrucomicrobiae bacterium]
MIGDNGHVKNDEVYLSLDGQAWNSTVAKGTFDRDANVETIRFARPVKARYLKFVALNEQNGHAYATIAELQPITDEHVMMKAQR